MGLFQRSVTVKLVLKTQTQAEERRWIAILTRVSGKSEHRTEVT